MPSNDDPYLEFTHSFYDPLYGYIQVTEPEFLIIRSPLFQRLSQIRQLGLVSVLFPSATHTRLSHCLGTLCIADRMFESVRRNAMRAKDDEIVGKLNRRSRILVRFAALLHDIGHLPFSHVGEQAYVELRRKGKVTEDSHKTLGLSKSVGEAQSIEHLHEELSRWIIEQDKHIAEAIVQANRTLSEPIKPEHISSLFKDRVESSDTHLSSFVHSGLDCDRLDFLGRDAYFVGSSYGRVELNTLLEKLCLVRVDENDSGEPTYRLCVQQDAALTADHFIMSRFYWYSVILGLPKVQLLDALTKSIITYLATTGRILSLKDLLQTTLNLGDDNNVHKIVRFQDADIIMQMRKLHEEFQNSTKDEEIRLDTSVKVLMGGNLSHIFCVKQAIMEADRYMINLENEKRKTEIASAENSATEEIRKQVSGLSRAFVKAVCRGHKIHNYPDELDGGVFKEGWESEVLVECDKQPGSPRCKPLQLLENITVANRLGSSRDKHELSEDDSKTIRRIRPTGALYNVRFAVFLVHPAEIEPSSKEVVEKIIKEKFQSFTSLFNQ